MEEGGAAVSLGGIMAVCACVCVRVRVCACVCVRGHQHALMCDTYNQDGGVTVAEAESSLQTQHQ